MNPLSDLITDEVYNTLKEKGLLLERAVRNYTIKKRYKILREEMELSQNASIGILLADYPYLQFDTIRKIIFKKELSKSKPIKI